jgi:hypothetical protein
MIKLRSTEIWAEASNGWPCPAAGDLTGAYIVGQFTGVHGPDAHSAEWCPSSKASGKALPEALPEFGR